MHHTFQHQNLQNTKNTLTPPHTYTIVENPQTRLENRYATYNTLMAAYNDAYKLYTEPEIRALNIQILKESDDEDLLVDENLCTLMQPRDKQVPEFFKILGKTLLDENLHTLEQSINGQTSKYLKIQGETS